MSEASFVAVDWGTTNFRIWVVDKDAKFVSCTKNFGSFK